MNLIPSVMPIIFKIIKQLIFRWFSKGPSQIISKSFSVSALSVLFVFRKKILISMKLKLFWMYLLNFPLIWRFERQWSTLQRRMVWVINWTKLFVETWKIFESLWFKMKHSVPIFLIALQLNVWTRGGKGHP